MTQGFGCLSAGRTTVVVIADSMSVAMLAWHSISWSG